MTRLLHVSDLHYGSRDDPAAEHALAVLVERAAPQVVVASGDLAHRGRRAEHERAAAFLRGLGTPILAVPGNHDIPYTFPARFTRTFGEFERHWGTTRPVYRAERLVVVGLNSVLAWRHQTGGVDDEQLDWAATELALAPERALRVVVLHHHLINAPWRTRKRPVVRRKRVLARLVQEGAELVLAGHTHQAAVSERHEFEIAAPGDRAVITLAVAAGFGRPRPRRRGEARGVYVVDADDDSLTLESYVWRADAWERGAVRRFPRAGAGGGDAPLTAAPPRRP